MGDLPGWAWLLILSVIVSTVLGVLYTLSSLLRDFHRSRALKQEVERLHREYAARLQAVRIEEELNAQVQIGS